MIYTLRPKINDEQEQFFSPALIEFPSWQDVGFTNPALDFSAHLPIPIEFVGDLEYLSAIDFPSVVPTMPLVSAHLLTALRAAGDFPFRTYPTRIYSNTIEVLVQGPSNSTRTAFKVDDPALYTERFVIVQLLQHTDALDPQRSLYADTRQRPVKPRRANDVDNPRGFLNSNRIERLVLTEEESTLPGVFMFPQFGEWMCSDRTVQACFDAGVTGVEFEHIPVPLASGARQVIGGFRYFTDAQLDQVPD